MAEAAEIRPQVGPQEQFLASSADIAIYGGAAGGGKSFALLVEPLRHVTNTPGFFAAIFRRNSVQVRYPGGLWDASLSLYGLVGGKPVQQVLEWSWPKGGRIKFGHLEHATSVLDWQGTEVPFIGFDELTHFEEEQFWYMLSRNRSTSGVRGYIRATCNPDADSWVARLIAWWIDQDTGFPIAERAGVIRWFVRINGTLHWADGRDELVAQFGPEARPKSLTFIPATLDDNAVLMSKDPDYKANLLALPDVDQKRLLGGNWKVRQGDGKFFKRAWFKRHLAQPTSLIIVGSGDLAVTEDDGDNTELAVWGIDHMGDAFALDWWSGKTTSDEWIEKWIDMAKRWNPALWLGEGGVIRRATEPALRRRMRERNVNFWIEWLPSIADKLARSRGFQARASGGRVSFPMTDWAEGVIDQLVGFSSEATVDDKVDTCSLLARGLEEFGSALLPEPERAVPPPPTLGRLPARVLDAPEAKPVSRYKA